MADNKLITILIAGIGILIIGIVLAQGVKILNDVRTQNSNFGITSKVTNQTQANTANGTVYTLNSNAVDASTFKWYQQNGSANGSVAVTLLNSANYSLSTGAPGTAATAKLTSNVWNNGNATWDYNETADTEAGASIRNSSQALGNIASGTPNISTIIIAGIVVSILIGAMAFFFAGGGGNISFR